MIVISEHSGAACDILLLALRPRRRGARRRLLRRQPRLGRRRPRRRRGRVLPAAVRHRAGRRRPGHGHQPGPARRRAARPGTRAASSWPAWPTPTWWSTSPASSPPSTRPSRPRPRTRAFDVADVEPLGDAPEGAEEGEEGGRSTPTRARIRTSGSTRPASPRSVTASPSASAPSTRTTPPRTATARRRCAPNSPPSTASSARASGTAAARHRHQPRRVRLPRRPVQADPGADQRPVPGGRADPAARRRGGRTRQAKGVTTIFFETLVSPKIAETLADRGRRQRRGARPDRGPAPGRRAGHGLSFGDAPEPRQAAHGPRLSHDAARPRGNRRGGRLRRAPRAARRRPVASPPARRWRCSAPTAPGKSTLIRAALGLAPLRRGEAALFGVPLRRFRHWRRVGYVPQRARRGQRRAGHRARGRRVGPPGPPRFRPPGPRGRPRRGHVRAGRRGPRRPRRRPGRHALRRPAAAGPHRPRAGRRARPAGARRADGRRRRGQPAGVRRRARPVRPRWRNACSWWRTNWVRWRRWCTGPSSCTTAGSSTMDRCPSRPASTPTRPRPRAPARAGRGAVDVGRPTMSFFEYDFMVRALIGVTLTGLIAPAIGIYLVQRRLSLIGDGLGHVALTGVGVGLLLHQHPGAHRGDRGGARRGRRSNWCASAGARPATWRWRSCSTAASPAASCW